MASQKVNVVFDRKKVAEKRGQGIVEMQVYLSRRERKYIPIGKCSPDELDDYLSSRDVKNEIKRCNDIISAMLLFNDEMTVQQFDGYYLGKRKSKSNNLYKGTDQATNFIIYL
ncbi:MAG: transposase, partial [Prevotella sp.]|nr:transposase [Prevotella sp.]